MSHFSISLLPPPPPSLIFSVFAAAPLSYTSAKHRYVVTMGESVADHCSPLNEHTRQQQPWHQS